MSRRDLWIPLTAAAVVGFLVLGAGPWPVSRASPVPSPRPGGAGGLLPFSTGGPRGWKNLTSSITTSPSSRAGAATIYDGFDRYVLQFGGESPNGSLLQDSWTYHRGVWTKLTLPANGSPPARAYASIAFDRASDSVVLFGGLGYATGPPFRLLNDTWVYHGGGWKNVTPSISPPPRYDASMTYDVADRYVLLYGGDTPLGAFGDTWTFGGRTWTHLAISSPTPRSGASMTYDFSNGWAVLICGIGLHGTNSHPLNWTWSFHNGTWVHAVSTTFFPHPELRFGGGFASSPNTTLFVGGSESPNATGEGAEPFYLGSGGPLSVRWTSQLATTHRGPPIGLPDRFPGFVWDDSDGYFLYLFDDLTWETPN